MLEKIKKEIGTPKDFLGLLKSYGFHISDGVDSCSGHDEEEEKQAALEIFAKIVDASVYGIFKL
jgi:hypothetical protein